MKTLILLTTILFNGSLLDQPYSLTVERVTPALLDMCRNDDNCIDINEIEGCTTDLDCALKHPEVEEHH